MLANVLSLMEFDKDSFIELKNNVFKLQDNLITISACYNLYPEDGQGKSNSHIAFALKQTQLILDDFQDSH